jgi:hypothetical protein
MIRRRRPRSHSCGELSGSCGGGGRQGLVCLWHGRDGVLVSLWSVGSFCLTAATSGDGRRECLPHLPQAYRRKVLIECNMNVDAAVERLIEGLDET